MVNGKSKLRKPKHLFPGKDVLMFASYLVQDIPESVVY